MRSFISFEREQFQLGIHLNHGLLVYLYMRINTWYDCICIHKLYIHTGMSESPVDELRSILAQLHYTYHIREWNRQGVPFCTHAYVPETDPITGEEFHEREDHGHLLQVY